LDPPVRTYSAAIVAIGLAVGLVGAALTRRAGTELRWLSGGRDIRDLAAISGLYVVVVAGLWLAFGVFTTDNVLGLFLVALTAGIVPLALVPLGRRRSANPLDLTALGLHLVEGTMMAFIGAVTARRSGPPCREVARRETG